MVALDFIMQVVFPIVGIFTGNYMSFSPYRAVLQASQKGTLGDLNPTPWVFMLGNCAGWLAYSYFTHNVFVLVGNAPGFVLAIWLNIQAIKLQYENFRSAELQNAIIEALENMRSVKTNQKSQTTLVNKKDVTRVVEHALSEEAHHGGEILNPMTTAPVHDEEMMSPRMSGRMSSSYQAMNNSSTGRVDIEGSPGSPPGVIDEEATLEGSDPYVNPDDDGITTIFDATDHIMDYATFIWDITTQKTPAPASHEIMVVAICTVWLFIISYVVFMYQDGSSISKTGILIVGLCVNVNLIFFYGAPLSKIGTVIATRSSKLIHVQTMFASLVNATLWAIYGVAVGDYFIAVPNGLGSALGVVQVFFWLIFPRHRQYHSEQDSLKGSDAASYSTGTLSFPQESTPLI